MPGTGLNRPSAHPGPRFGAQVAAALGLPFAFASHFRGGADDPAVDLYRARFKVSPVAQIDSRVVILGVNIVAAGTG